MDEQAGVVAELRALRARLGETDDIARECAGLLSETVPKVMDLEETVAALRGTVAALVADADDTPAEDPALTAAKERLGLRDDPRGPWCWPLLDPDQAAAAWEALVRWVDGLLVPTYGVTRGQLPDCWPQHPRMVAEMTWLRHTYLEAHQRDATAVKAQDWHLRALPGALLAIQNAIPTTGGHRPDPKCGPGHHLQPLDPADAYAPDREDIAAEPARARDLHADDWATRVGRGSVAGHPAPSVTGR